MKLSRINTLLLVAILLINGYIIVLPVIPNLFFRPAGAGSVRRSALEAKVYADAGLQENSDQNRLVMPSILLDQQVFDGPGTDTLKKGLWHRPGTSTPDKGSNTVIAGHRLTYTNPRGVLYHLDKVKPGDSIGLSWEGKNYVYSVTDVIVVPPNATEIEAPTANPQLTIYTCTPLWLPKDRLVVVAVPEVKKSATGSSARQGVSR
jgi:LPXTG-site transpeptidase (sortase) family protein